MPFLDHFFGGLEDQFLLKVCAIFGVELLIPEGMPPEHRETIN